MVKKYTKKQIQQINKFKYGINKLNKDLQLYSEYFNTIAFDYNLGTINTPENRPWPRYTEKLGTSKVNFYEFKYNDLKRFVNSAKERMANTLIAMFKARLNKYMDTAKLNEETVQDVLDKVKEWKQKYSNMSLKMNSKNYNKLFKEVNFYINEMHDEAIDTLQEIIMRYER